MSWYHLKTSQMFQNNDTILLVRHKAMIYQQLYHSKTVPHRATTVVGNRYAFACADPEEGTGGPDPSPLIKSQKYRVS